MKKLLASILTLALAVALSLPAMAAEIKFTDVPDGQWYTDAIYACAKKGLVSGVGNNEFNPHAAMSRSQFITVVVRYLFPDAVKNYDGPSTNWWDSYYNIAVEKGLITVEEFRNNDTISLGMTRQEMALVISRALGELGQTPDKLVYDSQIPDYNSIGTYYRNGVKVTYTAGIITGTDSSGTFSPMGTLTRAQACTVLMRITEPTSRTPSTPNQAAQVSTEVAKWVMGETHYTQPKVGDIVVVNGYEVVLEMQYGVLGAGQQAPDGTYVNVYSGWTFESTGSVARDGRAGELVNPETGKTDDMTPFGTDPRTGQMFTDKQWKTIRKASFPSNFEGEYDGEVFRTFWSWNATEQSWDWLGQ